MVVPINTIILIPYVNVPKLFVDNKQNNRYIVFICCKKLASKWYVKLRLDNDQEFLSMNARNYVIVFVIEINDS